MLLFFLHLTEPNRNPSLVRDRSCVCVCVGGGGGGAEIHHPNFDDQQKVEKSRNSGKRRAHLKA